MSNGHNNGDAHGINGGEPYTSSPETSECTILPGLIHWTLRYRLLALKSIFFLLGVGVLLPWNAFMSVNAYFEKRLCTSHGKDTANFELWFGFIWNIASITALGGMIIYRIYMDKKKKMRHDGDHGTGVPSQLHQQRAQQTEGANGDHMVPTESLSLNRASSNGSGSDETNASYTDEGIAVPSNHEHEEGSTHILIMVAFTVYLVCFILSTVFVLIPNIDAYTFSWISLAMVYISGMFAAFANAGIVATAAIYSPEIGVAPFFSGQALGGLGISIVNFGAAMSEDASEFIEEFCVNDEQPNSTFAFDMMVYAAVEAERDLDGDLAMTVAGEAPECYPYTKIDWGILVFFSISCAIIVPCIWGVYFIHKHQFATAYERLDTMQEDPASFGTPRIGLEMNAARWSGARDGTDEGMSNSGMNGVPGASGSKRTTNGEAVAAVAAASEMTGHHGFHSDSAANAELNHNASQQRVGGTLPNQNISATNAHNGAAAGGGGGEEAPFEDEPTTESADADTDATTGQIFSLVWGSVFGIFTTFAVTLSIFPGWLSQLEGSYQCQGKSRLFDDLYTPYIFVLFNIGDFTGRILAGKFQIAKGPKGSSRLVMLTALRILSYPLFLSCVSHDRHSGAGDAEVVIDNHHVQNDVYFFVVMMAFSISNGLFQSWSFIHAPSMIPNKHDAQEISSEILSFAVNFGLLTGSILSFPFTSLANKI